MFGLNLLLELRLKDGGVGLGRGAFPLACLNAFLQIESLFVGQLVSLDLSCLLVCECHIEFGNLRLDIRRLFCRLLVLLRQFQFLDFNFGLCLLERSSRCLDLLVKVSDLGGEEALGIRPRGELRLEAIDMIDKYLGSFLSLGELCLEFADTVVACCRGCSSGRSRVRPHHRRRRRIHHDRRLVALVGVRHGGHDTQRVAILGRTRDGIVCGSFLKGANVNVAVGMGGLLGQDHRRASLAILDVDTLGVRHEEEADDVFVTPVAEGQVEREHALIVLACCALREGVEKRRDGPLRGAEDDRGVERQ